MLVAATCINADSPGNNQLLYFTSSSLTADERHLFFISDRTGQANLFVRDLTSGKERQLSANTEGSLKAYVYFDGDPYRGFGKASVSLDEQSGTAYYIQGRNICAVTLDGKLKVLAELPPDQVTAFTHVSADGLKLCVPTTDARALDGDNRLAGKPDYDIDERVRTENLSSYLRVYDTRSGKEVLCERVPQAWITHVQFSPLDSNSILYNHEWASHSGIRRMWLWDGNTHLRLRTEGDGRSRLDWTCHEMWERDGKAIIYHGGNKKNGMSYLGRVNADGSDPIEIALPDSWKRYGHFTVGNPGELVTDGYYEQADDVAQELPFPAPSCGQWISLLKINWPGREIQWQPLCRHGSSWQTQDSHPHPIFDHTAAVIYFTSDKSGKRALYRVPAPFGDFSKR